MYPYTCNKYGGECCGCGDCRKENDDDYWQEFFAEHEYEDVEW
nr:MAG TPA: hypothetical protein [Caudoviricetes sp.]